MSLLRAGHSACSMRCRGMSVQMQSHLRDASAQVQMQRCTRCSSKGHGHRDAGTAISEMEMRQVYRDGDKGMTLQDCGACAGTCSARHTVGLRVVTRGRQVLASRTVHANCHPYLCCVLARAAQHTICLLIPAFTCQVFARPAIKARCCFRRPKRGRVLARPAIQAGSASGCVLVSAF